MGRRLCLPAKAGIQEAPDQQETKQHDAGIEVGMRAAGRGFPNADPKGEDQGEGDRNIHIRETPAERGES